MMFKKQLLTTILLFITSQSLAGTASIKSHVFGPLKISYDENSKLLIFPSDPVASDKLNKQLSVMVENYDKQYAKLLTPEQRAAFAYQFLLKFAYEADFKISLSEDYYGDQTLVMYLYENNRHSMLGHLLIPAQDIATVYPLLIELIKKQK